jgi:hypothetical protein
VGCYSSGRYLSGALHRVILGEGLEGPLPPNTTIYYRCGDPSWDDAGGDASENSSGGSSSGGGSGSWWSEEFSFRTAPLTGAPGALPYRLGLIGDLGQSEHSVRCAVCGQLGGRLSLGTYVRHAHGSACGGRVIQISVTCCHQWPLHPCIACLPSAHLPARSTLDHLDFNSPDSIILTGDLSYADGYQPRW